MENTTTPNTLAPTASRIESLDAIRGIAVLGIFVINIVGFGLGEAGFASPLLVGGDGPLNHGLWTFTNIFVEGSMRGLFSLLFGAGIVLFTSRALYPDGPIVVADLYYRRTFWLIVFGLVHSFGFLAPGDILLIYGIAAVILFPFRILSPQTLLILAAVTLTGLTLSALDGELAETAQGLEAVRIEQQINSGATITEQEQKLLDEWHAAVEGNLPRQDDLQEEARQRTGDVATVYSSNAAWVVENSQFFGIVRWVIDGMLMMFIGMALFKLGVLTGNRNRYFYVWMVIIGYGIGLSFRIWAMYSRWTAGFSPILWAWGSFNQIARLAVTLGHIGLFFLLWSVFAQSWLMRALTAAGRMALSNYIGQSLIANLIFSGIGFGLFATMDFAEIYLVMVAIWIVQLLFSVWWLSGHRYGPLEWIWRALTYGRRP